MGFGDLFERKVKTKTKSTLTPEQEELLKQLSALSGQYAPQTYQYLAGVMGGQTGLTPEAIEQFYQQGVLSPAMKEWEAYTRPQIEEQFGNRYHSSARAKTLSRAFSDLMTNMGQTRANLQYQGILQNLQARMQAAGMVQGQISAPLGVRAREIIASQQASPFDIAMGVGSTAAQLGAAFGGGGSGPRTAGRREP